MRLPLFASIAAVVLALPLVAVAAPAAVAPSCDEAHADAIALGLVPEFDVSAAPCQGIRPGGALILRAGPIEMPYCSMSFLVTDGESLYVTTAGHCVEDSLGVPSVGDRVSAHGVPGTFGTVVYQWCEGAALNGGCSVGTDFGIIRIDDDKRGYASAAMCGWGAPTGGTFTGEHGVMDDARVVKHFGWGMGVAAPDAGINFGGVFAQPANPATQAREGVLVESSGDTALIMTAAFSGDSGSGVMVTGLPDVAGLTEPEPQALGVLTHISSAGIYVQRLDTGLARAGAELGKTFTLVSA